MGGALVCGIILTYFVESLVALEHISLNYFLFCLDRNGFISCLSIFIFRPYLPNRVVLRIGIIPIIFEEDILQIVVSLGTTKISFNFVHFVKSILIHVEICLIAKRSFISIILLADIHIHVVLEHHVYFVLKLVYTCNILLHISLIFDVIILSKLSTLLVL